MTTYFCTCCGETHELETPNPLRADSDIFVDAPSWFGLDDYENDSEHDDGICEDCYDAILMDGGHQFPVHDLL